MKKHIKLFGLLLSIISVLFPMALSAQVPGNEYAIFNWQNNEDFNAFLNIDIDSITYSKVDLNGRTHHNVVVQEVWTPDSVYRIPITAIDSIAFRAPDPILKEGIFHIREFHYPYVTEVTDLSVTFNASIPADSLPVVGQVVITDVYEGLLEQGFAGRVINIVRTGSTVLIECEEVTPDDVYDLLVCVGKSVSYVDEDSPTGAPKKIRIDKDGVLTYEIANWCDTIVSGEDDNVSGNVVISIIPSIKLDYAICYKVKDKENRFKCVVSPVLDCDFDANFKVSGSVSFPKQPKDFVSLKIPTRIPGLVAKVGARSFLDLSGSAELDIKVPLRLQANAGYDSQRKKYNQSAFFANFDGTGIRSNDGASEGNVQVKLEGSIFTGLSLNFTVFFLHEKVANAKIGLKAGPKFTANIDYSNDLTHLPSWYDFKDTKVTVDPLVAQLTASVETFFTDELPWSSPQASIFGQKDYYLFPTFTAPVLPSLDTNGYSLTALTTDISRNLIFKVTPGIGLYENNQLKFTYFSGKAYKRQADWDKKNLQMELHEQYPSGTYTTKPIFKLFNSTIAADSTSTVTIPEEFTVQEYVLVKKGETNTIQFSGGWGDYTLNNSNPTICTATLAENSISIIGKKAGNATLTLSDRRSGEEKTVDVTVFEHSSIIVSPTSLDYGIVAKGSTVTKTFTVTGSNLTSDLTVTKSGSPYFSVNTSTITPFNGLVNKTVTVTYKPNNPGNHSAVITVSDGTNSENVSLSGTCPQPQPNIDVYPTSLDYGTVAKGSTVTQTFTVEGSNLTTDLTLSRSGSSYFSISPTTITPVNGTVNETVTVAYNPTATGNHSATVTVSHGSISETVDVAGRCVSPSLSVSTSQLDFGTFVVGEATQKTFTVTGTNTVDDISFTLRNTPTYADITINPSTLPPSGGTVTVTCNSSSEGDISGELVVSSTGASDKVIDLLGNCVEPYITVSTSELDFGNISEGQIKQMSFAVTGTNTVGNISLALQNTSTNVGFNISPQSLPASGGTVTVTCMANSAGSFSGRLIASSTGAEDVIVTLLGNVIGSPSIFVLPRSLNFGTVAKGETVTQTFTVEGSNLTSDLTLTRSGSSYFSISPSTITPVNGSVNETVTVTYYPTATGNHSADITISHGSIGNGYTTTHVTVSGKCVQPSISVSTSQLDFGTFVVGEATQKTFTVTGINTVDDISFTLRNTPTYADITINPSTLPPSGGTVTVTCNSSSEGDISGELVVSSTGASDKVIDLLGNCVEPYITVSTSELDFGNMSVGQSRNMILTVTGVNTVDDISLMLQMTSVFADYTVSPQSLPASGGRVTVTCDAISEGAIGGRLVISSPGADNVIVTIKGTITDDEPSITVSPSALNFGTVAKGDYATKTFTVTGSNLASNLTLTQSGSSYFSVSPTTITPFNGSVNKTITVMYKPTAAGNHSGSITVSGGGANSKTVYLSGTCAQSTQPTIQVSPNSINVGNLVSGRSTTVVLDVTGTDLTNNITATVTNTCSHATFSISPQTLPASGGSISLICRGTTEGNISGYITLSSPGANDVKVFIGGTVSNSLPND